MKKQKMILIGIIIALIAIGSVAIIVNQENKKIDAVFLTKNEKNSKEPVKLAFIAPLTGSFALIGSLHQKGILLAEKQSWSNQIKVFHEDDQGIKENSVSIAKQSIESGNSKILISPLSGVSFALAPIAEEKNVLLFSTAANPKIAELNDNTFRFFLSTDEEAKVIADFISDKNLALNSIAILYQNDEFGIAEKIALEKEFKRIGLKIAIEESFEAGASDAKTQLTKIIATNPDAIFFGGFLPGIFAGIKSAREFGFNGTYFGNLNIAINYPPFSSDSSLVEGIYVADFKFDETSPETSAFISEFQQDFNDLKPHPVSALEYSSMQILGKTIEICDQDIDCMKNTLLSNTFETMLGKIKFDENGNAQAPVILKQVVNGKEKIVHSNAE